MSGGGADTDKEPPALDRAFRRASGTTLDFARSVDRISAIQAIVSRKLRRLRINRSMRAVLAELPLTAFDA